jgi:hypothetical protein
MNRAGWLAVAAVAPKCHKFLSVLMLDRRSVPWGCQRLIWRQTCRTSARFLDGPTGLASAAAYEW